MKHREYEAEFVRLAQSGCQQGLARLAELARPRLCAYLYRVTLDADLADELTQDVLVQMVQSLPQLRDPKRFWPWLYRIALNRVRSHFARAKREATVPVSVLDSHNRFDAPAPGRSVPEGLAQRELARQVFTAMQDLSHRHRAILSLRCFDQLSYAQIAATMECTETGARALFFRAKQRLQRVLRKQGIGTASFVTVLTLFGRLTEPAEAAIATNALAGQAGMTGAMGSGGAVGSEGAASSGAAASAGTAAGLAGATIPQAMLQVGLPGTVVATLLSKVGLLLIAVAVAGVMVTSMAVHRSPASQTPARQQVAAVHFTEHSPQGSDFPLRSLSKGAYEKWFHFPEGPDGPIFLAMQRWDPTRTNKLCSWLQDEHANYYYHSGERSLYLNNYRLFRSNAQTWRLPTDEPELQQFLDRVEGIVSGPVLVRDPATALPVRGQDNRFVDIVDKTIEYRYSNLYEPLTAPWPGDPPMHDERDTMHRRGWTFFRVTGQINGQPLQGRGCLPFIYEHYETHSPWLELTVAERVCLLDVPAGACLLDAGGQRRQDCGWQSFFAGLSRPWMGLHTVDLVRRDAGREKLDFTCRHDPDFKYFTVILTPLNPAGRTRLVYTIDTFTDVLLSIDISIVPTQGQSRQMHMEFEYLQDLPEDATEFACPVLPAGSSRRAQEAAGLLWPLRLTQLYAAP